MLRNWTPKIEPRSEITHFGTPSRQSIRQRWWASIPQKSCVNKQRGTL